MTDIRRERFVVVGASGFIGRALVARLCQTGAQVTAISRHGNPFEHVRVASYLDESAMGLVIGEDCSALFHLAALAHYPNLDEEAFTQANVETALTVARAAITRGVRRFVFISSIGVIGSENHVPFTETTPPRPTAPYARSKWQAEKALRDLLEPTDVELVIVRPPLVHGPDAPGNFGRLAKLARSSLPLPLGSITNNARSLVGIDNLVDFLFVAATHPAAIEQALLVTDGEDVSTASLICRLTAAAASRSRVIRFPPIILDQAARWIGRKEMARQLLGSLRIDASRSATLLGWSPPISLEEGLVRAMRETQ